MASIFWIGGAAAVSQVDSFAFAGTWIIGENITVAYGSKTWVFTVPSTSIPAIVAALTTAYNAISATVYPEYAEQTASGVATPWNLTAGNAGKPFVVTVTTNSASGTIAHTTPTPSSGPNDVSTAANWSSGVIPASTLTAPVQSNASATAGGSLTDSTTYYWVVTATNANGETVKSNEKSLAISGSNQTGVLSWAAVTNATGYKIYRTTSSGTYGGTSLVTTITNPATLTYNDTGTSLSAGSPPGSSTALGDAVTIDRANSLLLYGLNQSTIILTSLSVTSPSVVIGLPKTNVDGTAYPEYRPDYWQIGGTSVYLNVTSQRIKFDQGVNVVVYEQDNSGNGIEPGVPAVLLKGTNASNTFTFNGGQAGLAFFAGENCTIATGRVESGAAVVFGAGCTLATLDNYGGNCFVNCAIGTALNHPSTAGAKTTVQGSGAVAQITLQGGTCWYNSTGTLGGNTLLANNAKLIFDNDPRAKTVTNPVAIYARTVTFSDNNGVISGGYTLQYVNCQGPYGTNSQVVVSVL